MGRKSLVAERREDILNAFEQCILEKGIQGSSFQQIGKVLGMDRNIISHYFGNREALVDAMAQRIVNQLDWRMNEALSGLEESITMLELVDLFYDPSNSSEKTEILWAEVSAYATRSETIRDRLRQSYEQMFDAVGQVLKREYPQASAEELEIAVCTISALLDRVPALTWLGVKGASTQSARAAISQILEGLK